MGGAAIELVDVGKRFRVARHATRTLKETLILRARGQGRFDDFTALEHVNLKIASGESVGVIGANGSGKSTLFKLICGILRPTAGEVRVDGRVSPLIDLSAGFHPELTGLENIYLNGAVYGMRRHEIAGRVEDIRAFADIGDFFLSPVRIYSSGMMARLAFALAINVNADILLIDEVLAVGDAEFQQRCLEKIRELKAAGVTIVCVSHDMLAIEAVADWVVLLSHGQVRRIGPTAQVIAEYLHGAPPS